MSEIHPTIKAFLYRNTMKNAKDTYLAQTSKYQTYNTRSICEIVKEKAGLPNADSLEYHVNLFLNEMMELIESGNKINTGYFMAQANIKGSFKSSKDNYDPKRHRVDISFWPGVKSREKASKMKAEILDVIPMNFGIWRITDVQTGLEVRKLVMNRVIIISGEKIKITGDDPRAGLYLINTESGNEIHMSASDLYKNGNAKIMLIVPELLPGNYQLKITTQYGGKGKPLASSRSCIYGNILQVE